MELNVIMPEMTGRTEEDVRKLRGYLVKLSRELEFTLENLDPDNFSDETKRAIAKAADGEKAVTELKQAIVNSATYVKHLEEKLSATLKDEYVAVSDIGTYARDAVASYEVGGLGITQLFSVVEKTEGEVSSLAGYIRTGVLDSGECGVEIGDVTGTGPFKVRLVDNRLSFFANGNEVAYVSDSTLYITKAQVTGKLILGDYEVDLTRGIAFKRKE